MKDKFELRILAHKINVIVESPTTWADSAMGRASVRNLEIRINEHMPKDAKESTLLHEILHIICDLNSIELSEQQVDTISMGLFTLLKDNKDFIASLCASEA